MSAATTWQPYAFPKAAAFGKTVPKNRIYQHASVSTKGKEFFVRQVEKIIWSYKLSPTTINIPPGKGVEEIQIFTVVCKGSDLNERVLRAIDKAIPSPILFIIQTGNAFRYTAAYKRLSDATRGKWVIGQYFTTAEYTEDEEAEKRRLPPARHLGALYEYLLRELIPVRSLSDETMEALLQRTEQVSRLAREYDRLESKMKKEKQFNRRVELNRQRKRVREDIRKLTNGVQPDSPAL